MMNLKYSGTLPLVEAARLLSLKHGIAETSTLARLKALRECDAIDADQFDYLSGGLNLVTQLLLRQQLEDFRAGKKVTNFVPKNAITPREKNYLADCFSAIKDLRGRLSSEFSGEF
jgi:signal-transduction protein with cAMP-binding, CBS, and nucleotidyltransferase domain